VQCDFFVTPPFLDGYIICFGAKTFYITSFTLDKITISLFYYLIMNNSMTSQQLRAEEIYLDSICYETDYKPVSFPRLKEMLGNEGISTSTSALGRWSKKFDWEEKVKKIVTAATLDGGEASDIIAKSSLASNTKKILTDFEANETLKDSAYSILQEQMKFYVKEMEVKKHLSQENTKTVIKILEVTSTREDKLLDRQAMLMATKLANSTDVLAALQDEVIEVEIDE